MPKSKLEIMREYQSALANVEESTGLVDQSLADAYFALTGTVFPSEYMGMPVRKFSGTSFDLLDLSITEREDSQ